MPPPPMLCNCRQDLKCFLLNFWPSCLGQGVSSQQQNCDNNTDTLEAAALSELGPTSCIRLLLRKTLVNFSNHFCLSQVRSPSPADLQSWVVLQKHLCDWCRHKHSREGLSCLVQTPVHNCLKRRDGDRGQSSKAGEGNQAVKSQRCCRPWLLEENQEVQTPQAWESLTVATDKG